MPLLLETPIWTKMERKTNPHLPTMAGSPWPLGGGFTVTVTLQGMPCAVVRLWSLSSGSVIGRWWLHPTWGVIDWHEKKVLFCFGLLDIYPIFCCMWLKSSGFYNFTCVSVMKITTNTIGIYPPPLGHPICSHLRSWIFFPALALALTLTWQAPDVCIKGHWWKWIFENICFFNHVYK